MPSKALHISFAFLLIDVGLTHTLLIHITHLPLHLAFPPRLSLSTHDILYLDAQDYRPGSEALLKTYAIHESLEDHC